MTGTSTSGKASIGRSARNLFIFGLLTVSGALAACDKDKSRKPAAGPSRSSVPTLRIYAVSGPAGAIEPCGCVEDMLGGIDHAAAFVAAQESQAPVSLVVGAGPMFFEDPAGNVFGAMKYDRRAE